MQQGCNCVLVLLKAAWAVPAASEAHAAPPTGAPDRQVKCCRRGPCVVSPERRRSRSFLSASRVFCMVTAWLNGSFVLETTNGALGRGAGGGGGSGV